MKQIFTFIIGICFILTSLAQDHLEPAGSIFDIFNYQHEYYSLIRQTLFKGINDKSEIRFLILPSFSGEALLNIEENTEKSTCSVIYRVCEPSIWYSKDEKKQVKVKEWRAELSHDDVSLLKQLYLMPIRTVRYNPNERMGLDGTNYYFMAWDSGLKSGEVWSPEGGKMAELVSISKYLTELVIKNPSKKIIFDEILKGRIKKLESELWPDYSDLYLSHKIITGEDFNISDEKINANRTTNSEVIHFSNKVLKQSLLVQLYTDNFRLHYILFKDDDIPKDLEKEISNYYIDERGVATKNGKGAEKTVEIGKHLLTSEYGIRLGDNIDQILASKDKADSIAKIDDQIIRYEWNYEGDAEGTITGKTKNGKPRIRNSFGQKIVMYFRDGKLLAMSIHNDIP